NMKKVIRLPDDAIRSPHIIWLYGACSGKLHSKPLCMEMPSFLRSCWIFCLFMSCQTQHTGTAQAPAGSRQIVGGGCDGCELMYIGMPEKMGPADTSAGWYEAGQKLAVTGTVYQLDGKTPAPGVIIYYWHTGSNGLYSFREAMPAGTRSHGYLRGWVRTDENGHYSIYTIRPAPYPNEDMPAHIHLSIKEPDVDNEYYTDDLVFDDDELLIANFKKYPPENRCGSGVLRVLVKDSIQVAVHDIVLGLNIPNYPKTLVQQKRSGLSIGEDQPSFIPFHAYGPDKGSTACPVCKYGRYHGVLYFVGDHPRWNEIEAWLSFLEMESIKRQQYLKVYFVYGSKKDYSKAARQKHLEELGEKLGLVRTALTFVPSFDDKRTEADLNRINPEVENTFIIYKHRRIIDKYIDLKPTNENFSIISQVLDKTKGPFFSLPAIGH
ncbi:MAG TPA: hypothetical protein VK907_13310, partial [Phnomibacter sp.]|nr:hypothetical protein [Phnomibacter sp.]